MKRLGFPLRRPRQKAKLTPAMADKRLKWGKCVQEGLGNDWSSVCFSDESMFCVSDENSQYVRRRPEEEFSEDCITQTVKHPTKVMVWSMMSVHGTGPLYIVKNMMEQKQYQKVLERYMISQFYKWFPFNSGIFMHNGAPCHKAKSISNFLEEKFVEVLLWPGNSPDMNPIENLWAIVKQRLKKIYITTKAQLIHALEEVWSTDPEIQPCCKKLVNSMPKRVNSLIKNKGFHTKY
jgi:hypothetical protein